jgi:hypothetical protein
MLISLSICFASPLPVIKLSDICASELLAAVAGSSY